MQQGMCDGGMPAGKDCGTGSAVQPQAYGNSGSRHSQNAYQPQRNLKLPAGLGRINFPCETECRARVELVCDGHYALLRLCVQWI